MRAGAPGPGDLSGPIEPMTNRAARIGRFFDERGRILIIVILSAAAGSIFGCGNFGHVYWTPGWISTIALLYRIFGPHYVVIRIFLIITALLTALLVHRAALRLAGMRAALVSPRVLAATLPFGICFYLVGGSRRLARALPAFLIGIALVLAPWTVRNYRCFGEFIPTTSNGGINLYIANNPHSTGGYHMPPEDLRPDYERHDSAMWYREAFRYIAAHPLQTAGRMLKKGLVFWNPHYGDQAVLLLFLVVGLIRIKRGGMRFLARGIFPLLAIPLTFTAVHMVFFVQPRYFIPVLPYVSIVAGIGLGGFSPRGRGGRGEHSGDIGVSGGVRHG